MLYWLKENKIMANPKVVMFTCNWNAYSGLETAGANNLGYSPAVRPIKVMCLGRLRSGNILKAFEKGAAGVLLMGCAPGDCYYEFGNRHAEEVFEETRELTMLLGYSDEQLQLHWVTAGDGEAFVKKVQDFVTGLNGKQRS